MLGEFGQQTAKGRGLKLCAQRSIGRWSFAQTLQKSFEIKAGASAKDGHAVATLNLGDLGSGKFYEFCRIEMLLQIQNINEMVRHTQTFRERGFRCPEIQPSINLHGINGNDFAAEAFGQEKSDVGFAGGSWSPDQE